MQPPREAEFFLFASDVTPAVRPYANTLDDRSIVYHPNPAPGNKPIAVGHAYSTLAYLPEKPDSTSSTWVLPLSIDRVKTTDKGHEVGPFKLCELINEKTLPSDQLCVHVGDSAYFTLPIREKTSDINNLISMARLRNNRTLYLPYKGNGKKKYGEKMKLNKLNTHAKPDDTIETERVTAKGRRIKVQIKVWHGLFLRGSKKFKGYEHPINLYQVCQIDAETGKKLFQRPMWLAVAGERRGELAAVTVYECYTQRYDIEHFFRFGKQKLLIDSFQTPEVTHEETWWQIAQIAYTQLYLSRNICQAIPRDWERYLPKFKKAKEEANSDEDKEESGSHEVSPTLAQRSFAKVLAEIGTPAHEVRKTKPGEGRLEGEVQEKRTVKPIIYKGTKNKDKKEKNKEEKEAGENQAIKEQKENNGEVQGFEKQLEELKPKNKEELINILKSWMPKLEVSLADLMLSLEKALPV